MGESGGNKNFDSLFMRYMNMSKLMKKYLSTSDALLAKKWIIFASKLPRDSGSIPGETRYKFIKHLFEVIKDEVYASMLETEKGKSMTDDELDKLWEELQNLGKTNDFEVKTLKQVFTKKGKDCMSMWSPDKRTYIAAKPIPGQGALIYLAVADRPDLGWDLPDIDID